MSSYKLRVIARGLFFNEKGEILLIKSQLDNYWALPGGGLEENESLTEALERELREETGYSGKVEKVVFLQEFVNYRYGKQLEVFFTGKLLEKKQEEADHESKFFNRDSFQSIEFCPKTLNPFSLQGSADYLSRFGSQ